MEVPGLSQVGHDISGQPPDQGPIEQIHVSRVIPEQLLGVLGAPIEGKSGLPVGSQSCPLNLNTYHSNSQLLRRTCVRGAISARCCNCAPP